MYCRRPNTLSNRIWWQMDDVTQQNAVLVEQAAAAAESLEEQAQHLAITVDGFKVDDGSLLHRVKAKKIPEPAKQKPKLAVVTGDWEEF